MGWGINQLSDKYFPGLSNILTKPTATASTKNKAGNPPKVEAILIPSIPALAIITQAIKPTRLPHTILIQIGASGLSGEIPVLDKLLIAEVLASAPAT